MGSSIDHIVSILSDSCRILDSNKTWIDHLLDISYSSRNTMAKKIAS